MTEDPKALTAKHLALSMKIRNLKGRPTKPNTMSETFRKAGKPQPLTSSIKYIEFKSENTNLEEEIVVIWQQ